MCAVAIGKDGAEKGMASTRGAIGCIGRGIDKVIGYERVEFG